MKWFYINILLYYDIIKHYNQFIYIIGTPPTVKTITHYVHLAAYQIDIQTAQMMFQNSNITLMNDATSKSKKNITGNII